MLVDYGFMLDGNEVDRAMRFNLVVDSTDDIHAPIKKEMLKLLNIPLTVPKKVKSEVSHLLSKITILLDFQ